VIVEVKKSLVKVRAELLEAQCLLDYDDSQHVCNELNELLLASNELLQGCDSLIESQQLEEANS